MRQKVPWESSKHARAFTERWEVRRVAATTLCSGSRDWEQPNAARGLRRSKGASITPMAFAQRDLNGSSIWAFRKPHRRPPEAGMRGPVACTGRWRGSGADDDRKDDLAEANSDLENDDPRKAIPSTHARPLSSAGSSSRVFRGLSRCLHLGQSDPSAHSRPKQEACSDLRSPLSQRRHLCPWTRISD